MDERDRAVVLDAQRRALAELPARAASNARATPAELGWPEPTRAHAMAGCFARLA